jgi:hypothetical protein
MTADGDALQLVSMDVVTIEAAAGNFIESVSRREVWSSTDMLASSGSLLTIGMRNWDDDKNWLFWQAKRAMLNRQLWGWAGRTYPNPIARMAANLSDFTEGAGICHSALGGVRRRWRAESKLAAFCRGGWRVVRRSRRS